MILSSDELEILEYLKSWRGEPVSMVAICRCASNRTKFKEDPNWAKPLMSRLVEKRLVYVDDRGHYRYVAENEPKKKEKKSHKVHAPVVPAIEGEVVDVDYFPQAEEPAPVGDDYFPRETAEAATEDQDPSEAVENEKSNETHFPAVTKPVTIDDNYFPVSEESAP
jgi:hypothetical protein